MYLDYIKRLTMEGSHFHISPPGRKIA